MHDPELEQLLTALRAGGPDFSQPPEAVRAGFDAMLATLPVADDLSFDPLDLNGVKGLRCRPPGSLDKRALLYLHGGAFVVGTAQGYRGLAGELARAARATVFAIDYRLAPEHPFPAAVDDTVAAYRGLLDQGFSPSEIAIAGDSAGGGLTIAALVAARDAGLPMPAATFAISPWVDLGCTGGTIQTKAAVDPSLTAEALHAMAARYLQKAPADTALASPLHADLSGLPPLLIQVGSSEILLDDAVRLAGVAGAAGVATRLEIWPEMVHVWHAFAFMLGAGRRAIADAGAFLDSHYADAR